MRPRQLLDGVDAEEFLRLVLEVDGVERAQRRALGLGQKVDARHDQVEVLGVGEVGQEGQDEADGQPPAQVLAHCACAFGPAHPQLSQRRAEGLPRVAAFQRHLEAVAHPAETDVEENEEGHDERIATDATLLDPVDEFYILVIGQRLVVEDKAAQDEVDDANQHAHGGDVGQQAVEIAHDVLAQEGHREHAFDHVAEVDKEVEDKAQRDHDVEEAAQAARLPDRARGDPRVGGVPQPREHVTESGLFARAAHHRLVDLVKADAGKVKRCSDCRNKEDLFNQR